MMALSTIASRRFEGALAIDLLVVPFPPIRPRCPRRGPLASPSCVPWLLLGMRCTWRNANTPGTDLCVFPSTLDSSFAGSLACPWNSPRNGQLARRRGSQRTDGRRLCAIDPRGAPSCRPSQQFRAFSMALVDVAFLPGLEQDGTCTCPRALALPWTDSWIPSRLFPSFPTWRPRSDGDHPARSFPIRPWNRDVAHRPGQLPCTSKERRRHVDVPLSSIHSDERVGGRGSLFLSCPSKERERTEPLGIESSFLRVDERKGSGPPRARRRWRTKGRWKTCGWKHTKWRAVRPC